MDAVNFARIAQAEKSILNGLNGFGDRFTRLDQDNLNLSIMLNEFAIAQGLGNLVSPLTGRFYQYPKSPLHYSSGQIDRYIGGQISSFIAGGETSILVDRDDLEIGKEYTIQSKSGKESVIITGIGVKTTGSSVSINGDVTTEQASALQSGDIQVLPNGVLFKQGHNTVPMFVTRDNKFSIEVRIDTIPVDIPNHVHTCMTVDNIVHAFVFKNYVEDLWHFTSTDYGISWVQKDFINIPNTTSTNTNEVDNLFAMEISVSPNGENIGLGILSRDQGSGYYRVVKIRSLDKGVTFQHGGSVNSPSTSSHSLLESYIDDTGFMMVCYYRADTFDSYVQSWRTDGTATTVGLNLTGASSTHYAKGYSFGTTRFLLVNDTSTFDLKLHRSVDDGATWAFVTVNPDNYYFAFGLSKQSTGEIVVVHRDRVTGEIRQSVSIDDGVTFAAHTILYATSVAFYDVRLPSTLLPSKRLFLINGGLIGTVTLPSLVGYPITLASSLVNAHTDIPVIYRSIVRENADVFEPFLPFLSMDVRLEVNTFDNVIDLVAYTTVADEVTGVTGAVSIVGQTDSESYVDTTNSSQPLLNSVFTEHLQVANNTVAGSKVTLRTSISRPTVDTPMKFKIIKGGVS
jgi:hypothetical protein